MAKVTIFLIAFSIMGNQTVGQSLRGSFAVATHQTHEAKREGLTRIAGAKQLRKLVSEGLLVPLPRTAGLKVDPRLNRAYRYCRPWTRKFLVDLGRAYHKAFGDVLQVNSAVRTVAYQRVLRERNGNAAPIKGPTASSHLTGATIDLAKLALKGRQRRLAWLRNYLWKQKMAGRIEVAEEFYQSVFHVMVFNDYGRELGSSPRERKATRTRHEKRKGGKR